MGYYKKFGDLAPKQPTYYSDKQRVTAAYAHGPVDVNSYGRQQYYDAPQYNQHAHQNEYHHSHQVPRSAYTNPVPKQQHRANRSSHNDSFYGNQMRQQSLPYHQQMPSRRGNGNRRVRFADEGNYNPYPEYDKANRKPPASGNKNAGDVMANRPSAVNEAPKSRGILSRIGSYLMGNSSNDGEKQQLMQSQSQHLQQYNDDEVTNCSDVLQHIRSCNYCAMALNAQQVQACNHYILIIIFLIVIVVYLMSKLVIFG